MRVTQRSMYTNMMGSMQSTLSDYMESITQGSSQKKLNRPSDDPAGAARVLTYRASLTQSNQHITNSSTAAGWLNGGMGALTEVSNVITSIRELAEQAVGPALNADQRKIIGNKLRQELGTLMNMGNVTHDGKYIFAGEQYDKVPFREGLAADLSNPGKLDGATAPNLADPPMQVTGALSSTAMVRFSRSGTIPLEAGEEPMEYQWSEDGGKTWKVGTIKEGDNYFDVGGARVTIPNGPPNEDNNMSVNQGYTLTPGDPTAIPPIPDKRTDAMELGTGSTLKVRPAMIYHGSDNTASANVSRYGVIPLPPSIFFDTVGNFSNDMLVRFDDDVNMTEEMLHSSPPKSFSYSYSPDGGITWITGNKAAVTQTFDPAKPPIIAANGFGSDIKIFSTSNSTDMQVRVTNGPVDLNAPGAQVEYQYSTDGGNTWVTGTGPVAAGEVFDPPTVGGNTLPPDLQVSSGNLNDDTQISVTGVTPPAGSTATPGTIEDGAEMDVTVTIGGVPTTAKATFADDGKGNLVGTVVPEPATGPVTFTLPKGKSATVTAGNGVNFTANSHTEAALNVPGGQVKLTAPTGATPPGSVISAGAGLTAEAQGESTARLVLPGGFLDVKLGDRTNGDTVIPKNAQISLQPQRSKLDFEILEDQYLSVNNIGKDIFGGLFYPKNGNGNLEPANGTGKDSNLFETVGRLIAACETNNTDEIANSLQEIEDAQKNVLYHNTALGGKSNRLDVTMMVLEDKKINTSERMSAVEDVDFTELMTKLTQQQIAYNTVLKSSSMIMQMNLMKFM